MENLDVIIIGAGPIGLACAIEAQRAKMSYVVLEKGTLVNSLYNYPANMTFFSTSEKLEIGEVPFVSNNIKPTRSEALEYYRRVADSLKLNVNLFEEVDSVVHDAHNDVYAVATPKKNYRARNIIISTGFYDIPVLLNVPGENLPKVTHYYKEPHFYYRQKVVVVGANNSAVDAALETYRKGAEVSMVVREHEIGERVKYWVRPDIVNRIKEGSIKVYFESEIDSIHPHTVEIKTPNGIVSIENDYVIAATGYKPNFSFLKKMGIELSTDGKFYPRYDKQTQETNLPNIYLAGVICGGMDTHVWFIENSRVHAQTIFEVIESKSLTAV